MRPSLSNDMTAGCARSVGKGCFTDDGENAPGASVRS